MYSSKNYPPFNAWYYWWSWSPRNFYGYWQNGFLFSCSPLTSLRHYYYLIFCLSLGTIFIGFMAYLNEKRKTHTDIVIASIIGSFCSLLFFNPWLTLIGSPYCYSVILCMSDIFCAKKENFLLYDNPLKKEDHHQKLLPFAWHQWCPYSALQELSPLPLHKDLSPL
jgi:hypothetical protein